MANKAARKNLTNRCAKDSGEPLCGCYYCLEYFPREEIESWADNGRTPTCPRCCLDAVVYPKNGKSPSRKYLAANKRFYFERVITPFGPMRLDKWQELESSELTTQKAAKLFRVPHSELIRVIEAGEIPHRKAGGRRRVLFADVLAYAQAQAAAGNPPPPVEFNEYVYGDTLQWSPSIVVHD